MCFCFPKITKVREVKEGWCWRLKYFSFNVCNTSMLQNNRSGDARGYFFFKEKNTSQCKRIVNQSKNNWFLKLPTKVNAENN